MSKPLIVLTGDDSIRAEGLILVKRVVEKFADIKIIGTKEQQSGAGAKINLQGGEWGTEIVDGVEAIWVDGSPADSVLFACEYLERRPDLIISGMNRGENITDGMLVSGTIGAAIIAAQARRIPSIAFSIVHSHRNLLPTHDGSFDNTLEEYPGRLIEQIVKKALEYKMPYRTFWNVNFPEKPTKNIKVVTIEEHGYYPNNVEIGDNKFGYIDKIIEEGWKNGTDAGELVKGFVTITPCKISLDDSSEMDELGKLFK